MAELDTNNNGYIDYTEFLAGCLKSKVYMQEENLRHAFEFFDKVSSQTSFYMHFIGFFRINYNRRTKAGTFKG